MTQRYLLLLHVTQQRAVATLLNRRGQVVATGQQPLKRDCPREDWAELDPLELVYAMRAAITQCGQKRQLSQVAAISLATCGRTALIWDRTTGRPLGPAIGFEDKRTHFDCLALAKADLGDYVWEKTGLRLSSTYAAPRMKWLLNHFFMAPGGLAKKHVAVGTLDSWLLYHLTGRQVFATDYSHASLMMLFDHQQGDWDRFLLREFLLEPGMLPTLHASQSDYGATRGFVPLPDGIPILGVGTTHAVMMHGANVWQFGQAVLDSGWDGISFCMNEGTTRIGDLVDGIHVQIVGKSSRRLAYIKELCFPQLPLAWFQRNGVPPDVFSDVIDRVDIQERDAGGLVAFPTMDGSDTLQGEWLFRGLKGVHSQSQLIWAYLEAMIYCVHDVHNALMTQTDYGIKELAVVGAFTHHPTLMQFASDILQLPLIEPYPDDVIALGSAAMIAEALDLQFKQVQRVKSRYVPQMDPITAHAYYKQWRSRVDSVP